MFSRDEAHFITGALTKGDRRAATGADLTEFNFDTPYGRQALRTMYHHISQKTLVPGLSLSTLTDDKYDFDTFNLQMQVRYFFFFFT